jgi:hypothetical protein
VSSPPPPFLSFFLSSLVPFFCLTAPQAFSRPDRVLCRPARADAVKAGRSSAATPPGAPAFTAIEHDSRLDGSGSMGTPVCYYLQRALFRSRMCFRQVLLRSPLARAIIASTYIRQLRSGLPRCCLHGRSRRRMGLILMTADWQRAQSAMPCDSHTSDLPDTPDWGGVGTQRTVDVIE